MTPAGRHSLDAAAPQLAADLRVIAGYTAPRQNRLQRAGDVATATFLRSQHLLSQANKKTAAAAAPAAAGQTGAADGAAGHRRRLRRRRADAPWLIHHGATPPASYFGVAAARRPAHRRQTHTDKASTSGHWRHRDEKVERRRAARNRKT